MTEYVHMENVVGDDRGVGPVMILREVHRKVKNKESAKIVSELVSVDVDFMELPTQGKSKKGHFNFTLHFHQRVVDGEFHFDARTAEREPLGDTTAKATNVGELNEDIGFIAKVIQEAYETEPFEFVELEAASIGGSGGLTDYEFKYESGNLKSDFNDEDLEDALRRIR